MFEPNRVKCDLIDRNWNNRDAWANNDMIPQKGGPEIQAQPRVQSCEKKTTEFN
jgi:hypothetical protein